MKYKYNQQITNNSMKFMQELIIVSLLIIYVYSAKQQFGFITSICNNCSSQSNFQSSFISQDGGYMLINYDQASQIYKFNGTNFQLGLVFSKQEAYGLDQQVGTFNYDGSRIAIASLDRISIISKGNNVLKVDSKGISYKDQYYNEVYMSKDGQFLIVISNTLTQLGNSWKTNVYQWNTDKNTFDNPYELNVSQSEKVKCRISPNNKYLIAFTNTYITVYQRNQTQDNQFNIIQEINQQTDNCVISDENLVFVSGNLLNIYQLDNGTFSKSQNITINEQQKQKTPQDLSFIVRDFINKISISKGNNQIILVSSQVQLQIYEKSNVNFQLKSVIPNNGQIFNSLDITDDSNYIVAVELTQQKTYIFGRCNKIIPNCEECTNQTICIKCSQEYLITNNNKCLLPLPVQSNNSQNILIIVLCVSIPVFCIVLNIVILYWYYRFYVRSQTVRQERQKTIQQQAIQGGELQRNDNVGQQNYINSQNRLVRQQNIKKGLSKTEQKQYISTILCSICQSDGVTHQGTCRHFYHQLCINQWVQRGSNCPQCMKPITAESILKLRQNKVVRFPTKYSLRD